jgi:hypothetical protein
MKSTSVDRPWDLHRHSSERLRIKMIDDVNFDQPGKIINLNIEDKKRSNVSVGPDSSLSVNSETIRFYLRLTNQDRDHVIARSALISINGEENPKS